MSAAVRIVATVYYRQIRQITEDLKGLHTKLLFLNHITDDIVMQTALNKGEFRPKLHAFTYRVFSEDVMVGLAAIMVYAVIVPFLFNVSPIMQSLFDYATYIVVAAFIAEYVLKLYLAESRISYVANLWHIIDLLIVVLATLDILNLGPGLIVEHGRLSVALRIVGIVLQPFLAFVLTGRTIARAMPSPSLEVSGKLESELQTATLDPNGNIRRCLNGKQAGLTIPEGEPAWTHFQDVKSLDLEYIEKATSIPMDLLESKLIKASFPRIDYTKSIPSIFLWDSRAKPADHKKDGTHIDIDALNVNAFNIDTNGILIVYMNDNIITLSTGKSDLFDRISSHKLPLEEETFRAGILFAILKQKIEDYGEIVRSIEGRAIRFEEMPVNKTSPSFLEATFDIKKELQKTISNLWHFRRVVHHIVDNKDLFFPEISKDQSHRLDSLYAESDYLYETSQNTRDSLISLIELHINTVSYDMNRVMKVIAVITCLAIIPAIAGGLLGVNLTDNPYPLKITEVFSLVFFLMLMGIYIFYKMDWLK